jgi:ankyrin repeat protein
MDMVRSGGDLFSTEGPVSQVSHQNLSISISSRDEEDVRLRQFSFSKKNRDHSFRYGGLSLLNKPVLEKPTFPSLSKASREDEDNSLTESSSSESLCKGEERSLTASSSSDEEDERNDEDSSYFETPDVFPLFESCKWHELRDIFDDCRDYPSEIRQLLTSTNALQETPLHVSAAKAPPRLLLLLLELVVLADAQDFLLLQNAHGNTPLHLACLNVQGTENARLEYNALKSCAMLAPQALSRQNHSGDTPMHLLTDSQAFASCEDFAFEAAAEQTLTCLLHLAPETATLQNEHGLTLLHVSIANQAHELVVVQLLQEAPEAAKISDSRGMLPLHYVAAFCSGETPWTWTAELIKAHPESIRARTLDGDTPLHLLMTNASAYIKEDSFLDRNTSQLARLLVGSLPTVNEEKHVVTEKELTKIFPIAMYNHEGLTPLHASALFEAPSSLVRLLLEHHPEVAEWLTKLTTPCGATPVHLACRSSRPSVELILVLATFEACAVIDAQGRTPLAVALTPCKGTRVTSAVVKTLCQAYAPAVTLWTNDGLLSVHCALQNHRRIRHISSVVKALLKACETPTSVLVARTHPQGNTPLHMACKYGAPLEVIELLMQQYPEASHMPNTKEAKPIDLLPWDTDDKIRKVLAGSSRTKNS